MSSIFRKYCWNKTANFSAAVSTWSPLATAFNSRPGNKLNISFTNENSGLFCVDELRTYDGFYLLKENVIHSTQNLINEATNPYRTRKIVSIFDDLSDTLCRVADLAEFVRVAHPDQRFSRAAEDACVVISGIVEKLNTNKQLYDSLRRSLEHGDILPTTEVDELVAKLFLFDFEQSGIHLREDKRWEVVALNDYILQLGQQFMTATFSSRSIPKEHIPAQLGHLFSIENGQAVVSGLCGDMDDEIAREVAYKVYLSPDKEQEHLLDQILASRYRLATLCGFETYAHKALKSSIAETPDVVWDFLVTLYDSLYPKVESDILLMLEIKKKKNPSAKTLAIWDIPYMTSQARKEWLKVDNTEFASYFPLGSCMEGLNNLLNNLYGISFVNEPVKPGETWNSDIYKLAVIDESEGLLGYIYCDFYERSGKPNQDCHFTIRGGRRLPDGSYQIPIVVVMLNIPLPRWSSPSLLTPAMVDNLFHEMGHAMHSMLARTEYQHVSGTRCTTDFAEVPSVLMEYFASDPRVLRTFAKHYKTEEPMPDDMIERLCASKCIFGASEMQIQVFYSILDQVYHGKYPLEGTTTEVLAEIQNKYCSVPYVPNTAWQLRFSHLVGYGAKYYSYLMSRAVASSIWQNMFSSDPTNRLQGNRYRKECLAHGGGKPPKNLIQDYLQVPLSPKSLASSLILDLENRSLFRQ